MPHLPHTRGCNMRNVSVRPRPSRAKKVSDWQRTRRSFQRIARNFGRQPSILVSEDSLERHNTSILQMMQER